MDLFLKTKFTIEPGHGMGQYSLGHVLWLAGAILTIILLGRVYKGSDEHRRRIIRWVLAALTLIDELYKDIIPIMTGQWDWAFLPLHICSISIFAVALHAITGSDKVAEFLYAVTLPTAIMALVFPNWTAMLPCCNYESIHSFSVHILLVIYPSMLLFGGFRPSFPRLRYSIIPFGVLTVIAVVANAKLGTNFFFLNGGESGNPLGFLERYVGGWYVLAFPLIAAVCWLPMYLLPRRLSRERGR